MAELHKIDLEKAELESRLAEIEPAAIDLLAAVWRALRRGDIPDRGAIDDAAIKLRDALNPDPLGDPNWLPPGATED